MSIKRSSTKSDNTIKIDESNDAHVPKHLKGQRRWFAVHTYSGYEYKVKKQLEARVTTMHLTDRIFQAIVPIEEVVEIRSGARKTVKHKLLPSYVLVDMTLDEETWHCVKETPGVTNFIGTSSTEPLPLEQSEVEDILRQMQVTGDGQSQPAMPRFTIGESVRIIGGPFADLIGQISEIHPDRNKLTVLVSFFNRETPVELDFLQVEKVN